MATSDDRGVLIVGLDEALKTLIAIKDVSADVYLPIRQAMNKIGLGLVAQIQQNLADNDSVGLDILRTKISSGLQVSKDEITVKVGAGGLPYAPWLEYGTGPAAGRPAYTPLLSITQPGQPLYEWVKAKHIAGIFSIKTKERMGGKQKQIDENQRAARGIWAGIRQKGTQAHPFFFIALDQQRENIRKVFEQAVEKMVKNLKNPGNNNQEN